MIRRPPRSTQSRSSAASDVYKSQSRSCSSSISSMLISWLRRCGTVAEGQTSTQVTGPESTTRSRITRSSCFAAIKASGGEPSCEGELSCACLLYTSPSPRDRTRSRMPSSA
eukprot:TRINITY_DN12301_c0_g1_i1.p2 TRINITY_DN12301_c0_g1~~TRINITY_DN12301_c0_g1_i1.p2  ORF type:complete len:112 (-),score=51.05 TRINITY_DN12301_c0_g1_i1:131-466(-)